MEAGAEVVHDVHEVDVGVVRGFVRIEVGMDLAVGVVLGGHVVDVVGGGKAAEVVEDLRVAVVLDGFFEAEELAGGVGLHGVAEPGGQVPGGIGPRDGIGDVQGAEADGEAMIWEGVWKVWPAASRVSGRSRRKAKMPVDSGWCSPKVSKSMKRLQRRGGAAGDSAGDGEADSEGGSSRAASLAANFSAVSGQPGRSAREKRKEMSSESW